MTDFTIGSALRNKPQRLNSVPIAAAATSVAMDSTKVVRNVGDKTQQMARSATIEATKQAASKNPLAGGLVLATGVAMGVYILSGSSPNSKSPTRTSAEATTIASTSLPPSKPIADGKVAKDGEPSLMLIDQTTAISSNNQEKTNKSPAAVPAARGDLVPVNQLESMPQEPSDRVHIRWS